MLGCGTDDGPNPFHDECLNDDDDSIINHLLHLAYFLIWYILLYLDRSSVANSKPAQQVF